MKQEESIFGLLSRELFWSVGHPHPPPGMFYETPLLPTLTLKSLSDPEVPVSNWGCSHAGAVIGQIKRGSMPLLGWHRFILL